MAILLFPSPLVVVVVVVVVWAFANYNISLSLPPSSLSLSLSVVFIQNKVCRKSQRKTCMDTRAVLDYLSLRCHTPSSSSVNGFWIHIHTV